MSVCVCVCVCVCREAEGKNCGHCIWRFHCRVCIEKGRGEQNVTFGFGGLTVIIVLTEGGGKCGWYVKHMDWCM